MLETVAESRTKSDSRSASGSKERIIPLPTLVSLAAILISLGTAVWVYRHDPLGPGLQKYDFTTPKATLTSQLQMVVDKSWRALIELNWLEQSRRATDKLKTFDIRKEAEWRGKKLLFVSYEQHGIPKYSVEWFEKDAATGMWQSSAGFGLIAASLDGSEEAVALSDMISAWEKQGRLD